MIDAFKEPEYLHVLLNPFPVYGLGIALLALLIGICLKSRHTQLTAMLLIAITCLSVWPVTQIGHRAHEKVEKTLSAESNNWMQYHEETSTLALNVALLATLIAILGVTLPRKYPRTAGPLVGLSLLFGALSLAASIRTSYAGGRIRHEEFRTGPAPTVKTPHHHHGDAESETKHHH